MKSIRIVCAFSLLGLVVGCAQMSPVATTRANLRGMTSMLNASEAVDIHGRKVLIYRTEMGPNWQTGEHTHFGEEVCYVIDGSVELNVDGKQSKIVKAGESFFVSTGSAHKVRAGDVGASVITVYLLEKDHGPVSVFPMRVY